MAVREQTGFISWGRSRDCSSNVPDVTGTTPTKRYPIEAVFKLTQTIVFHLASLCRLKSFIVTSYREL